jgi:hypothetical protein
MTCRSCGATIADKAIVCYRCGAPTALPAGGPARPSRRRPAGGIVFVLLLLALASGAAAAMSGDVFGRWLGIAGALVLAAASVIVRARRRAASGRRPPPRRP